MPNPYSEGEFALGDAHYRIHANGEQTHVVVVQADDRDWVAVAYDVYPGEYEPLAAEAIAYGPTKADAAERAKRWMASHPKGVLGDGEQDGGGEGWGAKIVRMLKGLNEYGNGLIDQNTPEEPKS